jgi:hypothetical protein
VKKYQLAMRCNFWFCTSDSKDDPNIVNARLRQDLAHFSEKFQLSQKNAETLVKQTEFLQTAFLKMQESKIQQLYEDRANFLEKISELERKNAVLNEYITQHAAILKKLEKMDKDKNV